MHLHFLMNQTVWTLDPLAVIQDLIETHVKGTNSTFHLNLSWKTGQWKTNPYILFLHKIDFCVFQTHFLRTVGELCISVWKNSLIKVVIKQQMSLPQETTSTNIRMKTNESYQKEYLSFFVFVFTVIIHIFVLPTFSIQHCLFYLGQSYFDYFTLQYSTLHYLQTTVYGTLPAAAAKLLRRCICWLVTKPPLLIHPYLRLLPSFSVVPAYMHLLMK